MFLIHEIYSKYISCTFPYTNDAMLNSTSISLDH